MKKNRHRLVLLRLLGVVLAVTMLFLSAGCQTTPAPEEPPVSSEEGVSSLPESTPAESEEVSEIPAESVVESISSKAEETKPVESAEPVESTEPTESVEIAPPSQEEPPKVLPNKAEIIQWEPSQTFIHQDGDWVYFRKKERTTWYCRNIKTGQENAFEVPDSYSRALFSTEDWLYCTDGHMVVEPTDSLESLFRVKKDGSEVQELKDTFGVETHGNQMPKLWGDWVYFGSRKNLYRISVKDNTCQTLADIGIGEFDFQVCDKGIFVHKSRQNPREEQIIRYDLDGQNPTVLWEETRFPPQILFCEGDYVYLEKTSETETKDPANQSGIHDTKKTELWRMRFDGTERQRIAVADEIGLFFDHNQEWIYYVADVNKERVIRRTRLDGSETQTITSPIKTVLWEFEIHGDYLYSDPGGALTRMELDGSNPVVLYSSNEDYILQSWFVKEDIPYAVVHPRSQQQALP